MSGYNQSNGDVVWKNKIKPWVLIIASIATWCVSMIFFVVGFSFGSQMIFGNYNVAFPVAVVTGLIISAIEIAFNDPEDRDDYWEWAIWIAANFVGVLSNVYGLVIILGISDPMFEKAISGILGALIEVAPERMLIKGMRNINFDFSGVLRLFSGVGKKKNNQQQSSRPPQSSQPPQPPYRAPKSEYKPQHRPQLGPAPQSVSMNTATPRQQPKPNAAASSRPLYSEPTYHNIGMNDEENLPDWARTE